MKGTKKAGLRRDRVLDGIVSRRKALKEAESTGDALNGADSPKVGKRGGGLKLTAGQKETRKVYLKWKAHIEQNDLGDTDFGTFLKLIEPQEEAERAWEPQMVLRLAKPLKIGTHNKKGQKYKHTVRVRGKIVTHTAKQTEAQELRNARKRGRF